MITEPNAVKSRLQALFEVERDDSPLQEIIDIDGCYASLFSPAELDKLGQFARTALGLHAASNRCE